ncbi:ATP-binding protein [Streptomyces griseoincarnatus]
MGGGVGRLEPLPGRDRLGALRLDFNLSFADVPFRSCCCYNTAVLSSDAIALVRQTHPKILEGDVLRDNPQYRESEDFVGDLDRLPLAPPPQPAAMMRILPTELHAVRAFVADQAKRCGLSADALHNLLVAVTEVATNAIRHGDAPVTLRTWPDDGLICEITDSGNWQPEEFTSWQPPESAVDSGFGLWGVGMLCDTRAGADRIERDDGTAAERLSGGCAAASGCPDGFRTPARGRASGLGRGAVQPTRQWAIRVSNGRSRNRPVGRQMSSGSHGGHHPEHHWRTHALMVEGDAWHSSSIQ